MSSDINLRVAAKAVIVFDGKILILREADTYDDGTNVGRYHLPGGRIETDESFYDGLRREVKEETGLSITESIHPLYVGEWWPEIRGQKNHIVALFMQCEATNDKVVLSDEHDDHKWIEPESYKDFDLIDPEDEVIEAFLSQQ